MFHSAFESLLPTFSDAFQIIMFNNTFRFDITLQMFIHQKRLLSLSYYFHQKTQKLWYYKLYATQKYTYMFEVS